MRTMKAVLSCATLLSVAASPGAARAQSSPGSPGAAGDRTLSLYRYEQGGTVVSLPEGVCDGVSLPIGYRHMRGGMMYKGLLAATTEVACVDGKAVLQGRFVESAHDARGVIAQSCAGILRLELTEEGLDATWRVLEADGGSCDTVGREYVTYDMLSAGSTRGSLISLANYASDALRPYATYRVTAPIACFQQPNNNSMRLAVLAEGAEFKAAQGENGTLVFLDSNQSPYLATKVGDSTCYVRAGFKYVMGL